MMLTDITVVASRPFGHYDGRPLFLVLERGLEHRKSRATPRVVWAIRRRFDVERIGESLCSPTGEYFRASTRARGLEMFAWLSHESK